MVHSAAAGARGFAGPGMESVHPHYRRSLKLVEDWNESTRSDTC